MGLPAKLTEEEQALLDRYALLKKKKRELQLKQAAEKIENQKALASTKKEGKELPRAPSDAKELAKRKILSGELKIKKDSGQREFKRARSHNEKKADEKLTSRSDSVIDHDRKNENEKRPMKPPGRNVYDGFVPAGRQHDSPEKSEYNRPRFADRNRKRIVVTGYDLNESILHNAFSNFGKIINIHPELERGQGFITFTTHEAAEQAIEEMHGQMVDGVTLRVFMAARPHHRGDNTHERRSFEADLEIEKFFARNKAIGLPFPPKSADLESGHSRSESKAIGLPFSLKSADLESANSLPETKREITRHDTTYRLRPAEEKWFYPSHCGGGETICYYLMRRRMDEYDNLCTACRGTTKYYCLLTLARLRRERGFLPCINGWEENRLLLHHAARRRRKYYLARCGGGAITCYSLADCGGENTYLALRWRRITATTSCCGRGELHQTTRTKQELQNTSQTETLFPESSHATYIGSSQSLLSPSFVQLKQKTF
eukprot:Seg44.6 transcript_id=Seg44.6/GoldUCD/mRNA.D3Y31 product="Negative elongation factor E" protein_id=Seg44.6/GoldUCD/D3Y31